MQNAILVGWCEFQLFINARFIYQACLSLSGIKVAKRTVDDVSFAGILSLAEKGSKLWKMISINKVSNFAAGMCVCHELISNPRSEYPSNLDPFQI